jgi:branched-chain amino acid transport system ATP-binding protein
MAAGPRAGRGVTTALELRGLSRSFGTLKAVSDVSLTVAAGSRHAVIGPNGAGKTTLFGLIAGTLQPTSGTILFEDTDVTRLPEHRRVRQGIAKTFQHSSLFLSATVLDNVLLAVQRTAGRSGRFLRSSRADAGVVERARDRLAGVGLADRSDAPAGTLSHGERRQLEVAVALATEPRLLLLDEPAAGMSAAETAALTTLVAELPRTVTIMLIEHDLDVVFGVADTVTVLHLGGHLMTGTPEEVRASDEVQTAYLGAADTSELFPGSRS